MSTSKSQPIQISLFLFVVGCALENQENDRLSVIKESKIVETELCNQISRRLPAVFFYVDNRAEDLELQDSWTPISKLTAEDSKKLFDLDEIHRKLDIFSQNVTVFEPSVFYTTNKNHIACVKFTYFHDGLRGSVSDCAMYEVTGDFSMSLCEAFEVESH